VDGLAAGFAAARAFVLGQVVIEAGKAAERAPQAGQSYPGLNSSSSRNMGKRGN